MTARCVALIVGAHTEIGKTHVACALLRAARDEGLSVEALKPVVSGFDPSSWADSDPGRLLAAAGQVLDQAHLDAISPWRFTAPLAPPMAAAAEGRSLPFGPIVELCRERIEGSDADLMVLEGVGGLMSPLAERATCLDLLASLSCRPLLVGGSYLGAISHTLTAMEVMRQRGLTPCAVVISEDSDPQAPDALSTAALTQTFLGGVPMIPALRGTGMDWAATALRAALA